MQIPCTNIAQLINKKTHEKIQGSYQKNTPPKVALFYVGTDPLTEIFIKKKQELAHRLGIEFEIFRYQQTPLFQSFAMDLRRVAHNKKYHGIIIQRPLPASLNSPTMENFIPLIKEIEGQRHKSPYISPIGLATLSILKYAHTDFKKWRIIPTDADFFKRNFKKKFIVIAGRGKTTGQPITRTMVNYKLAMVVTHSKTPNADQFYKQSDIIITTTGRPIIHKDNIKKGVILINYGFRREDQKTYGDYIDEEIKDVASHYTPVINGSSLIMLAYLMNNIANAYIKQTKRNL